MQMPTEYYYYYYYFIITTEYYYYYFIITNSLFVFYVRDLPQGSMDHTLKTIVAEKQKQTF